MVVSSERPAKPRTNPPVMFPILLSAHALDISEAVPQDTPKEASTAVTPSSRVLQSLKYGPALVDWKIYQSASLGKD